MLGRRKRSVLSSFGRQLLLEMESLFYNDRERVTLTFDDVSVANLSLVFSTDCQYVVDDRNRALLPGPDGRFSEARLLQSSLWKVIGREAHVLSPPTTFSFPSTSATTPIASTSGLSRQSTVVAGPPVFRLPGAKTMKRRIQLVDISEGKLVDTMSTYVTLKDGEFNVVSVSAKVGEAVNDEETYVLMDSRHQELMDCPVTQGKEFWSVQSRVVRACTEGVFSDFQQSRATPKLRKLTVSDCNVLEGRLRMMLEMTKAVSPATADSKLAIVLPLAAGELKEVVDALTCIICKAAIQKPVASGCCKSLIGCKTCCDLWFLNSSRCPKCNTEDGRANQLQLTGLDETFKLLLPVTSAFQ